MPQVSQPDTATGADRVQVRTIKGIVPTGDYKRAGGFRGLRRKITEAGGDPTSMCAEFGVRASDLDDPEAYLHYPSVIRLLEACAQRFSAPFFGFELGKGQSSEVLGPLAALLLAAPTVGEALRLLNRYMQVHAPGARYQFDSEDGRACIEYRVLDSGSTFSRQINEMSMATAYNIMRAIAGTSFRPIEINIASEPPLRRSAALESFFGAPLHYQQPVSSVVLPLHYLDQQIDTSSPALLRFAQDHLETLALHSETDIGEQVESAIRRLLPTGGCTLPIIAQQLGLHPRSLQNRLMEAGLEFREIVKQERKRQARAYLVQTRTPLAEIAMLLGYSDQAAFTRAFTGWTGESPMKVRNSGRQAAHSAIDGNSRFFAGH